MRYPLPASIFHESEAFAIESVGRIDLTGGIFYYKDIQCWTDCDGCIIIDMHELFSVEMLRYWLTHADATEESFLVTKNGDIVEFFIEG